jgi:Sulfate permease family
MVIDEAGSKDGSATTTGTSQSNGQGIQSVTIQAIPGESSSMDESKVRRRLVTTHRKTLDYIQTDGLTNRRYAVPDHRHRVKIGMTKAAYEWQLELKNRTGPEWLEKLLPMVKWLKTYQWRDALLHDVIAGCSVGVMVVPQSMSYAKLAGLPVEYGLYSALMPVFAYSMFGSSRQLAVGPVALISLLLSTGLSHELDKQGITRDNTPDYQEIYNTLAIQVSFLVGLMYIVLGLLR